MAGYFEIKAAAQSQFMFNLKSGNNEVILTSQTYSTKQSAQTGIESVKANAPTDARYERKVAADKSPYFVLKAGNGEVIGTSEMYSSTGAMESGITAVKVEAPGAAAKDLA